jgi:hypothetical protein
MAQKTTISVDESTLNKVKRQKPDRLASDEFLTALADKLSRAECRIEFPKQSGFKQFRDRHDHGNYDAALQMLLEEVTTE